MFLGGYPSYVQKDKELIDALDLNFKHVTAGAKEGPDQAGQDWVEENRDTVESWLQ